MSNYGIVEYFGCNGGGHACGYCKGVKPDNSDFGMWSHSLSAGNYQTLIDRGWRRSGKYCYKPIADRICCPAYTIRCDALDFKPSKSQKKVIKKLNKFLASGQKPSKCRQSEVHNNAQSLQQLTAIEPDLDTNKLNAVITAKEKSNEHKTPNSCDNKKVKSDQQNSITKTVYRNKAKALRLNRKMEKIMKRENCSENVALDIMNKEFRNKCKTKTLEEFINENDKLADVAHKLQIKYVSTTTDEYKDTYQRSHSVYKKYQMSIHKDTELSCTINQYKRFLIDSPLENETFETTNDLPNHFGSFHQQYWLNDQLIAVGVLDILPNCISSVYLYYDPDYEFLSLGTYSALREIYLVRQMHRFISHLKYYYMGFYIHSCPKMRYKGNFWPSHLLCPETFTWHSIEKCIIKLDHSKYSRFHDDLSATDEDGNAITERQIMILFNSKVITYREYKSNKKVSKDEDQSIKEYAKLIGLNCSSEILLYRK